MADQAKALLLQASAFSQTGTLTIVNETGVRIDGTNLIGFGVERPDSLITLELLGKLYLNQGNKREAIATLQQIVQLFPDSPEAKTSRPLLLSLSGNTTVSP